MTWLSSKTVILSVLTFLSFAIFTLSFSKPTYVSHFCPNVTTFAPESVYQSNLNKLLSKLSSEASRGEEFCRKTTGYGDRKVYGSYLCRGDVSSAVCKDCVAFAIEDMVKRCPVQTELVVWYDECMLRYSKQSFFDTASYIPRVYMWNNNTENVTTLEEFGKQLKEVMDESLMEVEDGAKDFLTKNTTFHGFGTVFSLMQCMQDLSGRACTECLGFAVENLFIYRVGRLGGRVLFPSCNVRFELYPFYGKSESNPSRMFPPPPPISSSYVWNSSPRPPSSPPLIPTPSAPDFPSPPGNTNGMSRPSIASITIAGLLVCFAFGACSFQFMLKKSKVNDCNILQRDKDTELESLQFNLVTIQIACKNFSKENKLGEGGFGKVYKGVLPGGQEIAVKRLSKSSGQGAKEFKNEVALVAKLQHRNLVRLLGFCLEEGETLLVYEFVPNKGLDYILFDFEKRRLMDWHTRCKIIIGIARGIMYLHEDSRLRVIHRDLKVSNVLLDEDMVPKISDFGMAKMVNIDEAQGNTKRIVGTYGYMAPEYAMEGLYSVKSDVFSFGVILLEILSGKKNSGFHLTKLAPSLLAHAWQLWNEGRCLDLMDPYLKDSFQQNEFIRYVHIGLLCVQEDGCDRPTMSSVILMLTTEIISLPAPERPAFSVGKLGNDHHFKEFACGDMSENSITISIFSPR